MAHNESSSSGLTNHKGFMGVGSERSERPFYDAQCLSYNITFVA